MATRGATYTSIFDRIVCDIDGTAESLFAVKQANPLQQPEGSLLLVAPGRPRRGTRHPRPAILGRVIMQKTAAQ